MEFLAFGGFSHFVPNPQFYFLPLKNSPERRGTGGFRPTVVLITTRACSPSAKGLNSESFTDSPVTVDLNRPFKGCCVGDRRNPTLIKARV
jgi:hypothetical protein